MTRVPEEGLRWQGPVVWWNPVDGLRHAFSPERRLHPGQERDTQCGLPVTLIEPDAVDWLMPTCETCMARACARMEDRRTDTSSGERREQLRRRMEGHR